MKLRILKKKYKKMYGKKPPEKLKKRIIKVMIRQSEHIKIKAIDQSVKEYCIHAVIAGTKTEPSVRKHEHKTCISVHGG